MVTLNLTPAMTNLQQPLQIHIRPLFHKGRTGKEPFNLGYPQRTLMPSKKKVKLLQGRIHEAVQLIGVSLVEGVINFL